LKDIEENFNQVGDNQRFVNMFSFLVCSYGS